MHERVQPDRSSRDGLPRPDLRRRITPMFHHDEAAL
jgi:hypothetical protein